MSDLTWPLADATPLIITYIEQRNFAKLDAIVANWKRTESIDDLRRDLGVLGGNANRRRTQATVNRETKRSLAVMTAALNGKRDPVEVAATALDEDVTTVRRAWIKWAPKHLAELGAIAAMDHPQFSEAARTAIAILKSQDTK